MDGSSSYFAVNVNPDESDATRFDQSLLPDWVQPANPKALAASDESSSKPDDQDNMQIGAKRSWVPLAMLLVVVLLVAEPIYLARRAMQ